MTIPILETRLRIPPVHTNLVSRPCLIQNLNRGLDHKLTLVSASAGFGKTTLLSEWVSALKPQAAWLSLDPADNDLTRFLTYVIAALQRIDSGLGQSMLAALQSSQKTPPEGILTNLLNEVSAFPQTIVLILDDYHVIESQDVHEALDFALEFLPTNCHFVLSSRVDPPLHLSRLRARGQLLELRDADLRFSKEDAIALFEVVMGYPLTERDVTALVSRTEGWIAGLQMAALSVKNQNPEVVKAFIADFTGSHRYIMDYLTEEVFSQQPSEIQSFLLETCVLDRLYGPLCDAVTEKGNGQQLLERLERENLFVVVLDHDRTWYRYHHLFADLLRKRLRTTRPEMIQVLHERASAWYEENGWVVEAVGHALSGTDKNHCLQLIEKYAFQLMNRGEERTVLGWLEALPEDAVRNRPWLSISKSWALMHSGQFSELETHLKDAEAALGHQENRRKGYIAAIKTYMEASRGEIAQAVHSAHEAIEHLSDQDGAAKAFTAAILSSLYRFRGEFNKAVQASDEAITYSKAVDDLPMTILAGCNLAGTLITQGELYRSAEVFRNALKLARSEEDEKIRSLPFAGLAATGLASVLREWNQIEDAEKYARSGVEISKHWGQAEVVMHGYIQLAYTLLATGDVRGAKEAIREAERWGSDLPAWTIVGLQSAQCRMHLAQGDIEAAGLWVHEMALGEDVSPDFQQMMNYITLARVFLVQGEFERASELLERLHKIVNEAGAKGYEIEILILQALAMQGQGRVDQALERLERALIIAESQGYLRMFIEEGAPMARLLETAISSGIAPDYASKLLAAFKDERPEPTASSEGLLVEPLSQRELEILALVAAGWSNRQIAEELYLAVGTVKKHLNNIFGKLQVERRTQAVARAKELGLL